MSEMKLRENVSEEQVRIHTPFSPTILEYKVPQRFLDIVNTSGDAPPSPVVLRSITMSSIS